MRAWLLSMMVLCLSLGGCSIGGDNEEELSLQTLIQERRQDLQRCRQNLAQQPQNETLQNELSQDVTRLVKELGLDSMTLEEPALFSQHIDDEMKALSKERGAEIEILSSELLLEENGYPVKRSKLSLKGSEEMVRKSLIDLAECRTGRFCRLRELELDRQTDKWSGLLTIDFYLRGGAKGLLPSES